MTYGQRSFEHYGKHGYNNAVHTLGHTVQELAESLYMEYEDSPTIADILKMILRDLEGDIRKHVAFFDEGSLRFIDEEVAK